MGREGFEPLIKSTEPMSASGLPSAKAGHSPMKVGRVTSTKSIARDNDGTASGQPKTDVRTDLEHTISIQKSQTIFSTPPAETTSTQFLPPDLTELAALWEHLPHELKTGFLAAARAIANSRR